MGLAPRLPEDPGRRTYERHDVSYATSPIRRTSLKALADAEPAVFWLDAADRPETAPTLVGDLDVDLAIVGSGYTGLWTALMAKEADPNREVVVLDLGTVGWAASGRNGGFIDSSLTHGLSNGLDRWPKEMETLLRFGHQNLDGLEAHIARYNIDCGFERTGGLNVATEEHHIPGLREDAEAAAALGQDYEFLDRDATRAMVHSPLYAGSVLDRNGVALVDPARLAWGLRRACEDLGVTFYDHTEVTGLRDDGAAITLKTPFGSVRAARVALGTNAFRPLIMRMRSLIVPVYDYVLATEPLSASQLASVGWGSRVGVSDTNNQFHYYRLTQDNRIIWGGYDAIYNFGNDMGAHHDQRPETFGALAEHFFLTFPQLEGLQFTHSWGGAIDTCSRFSNFWGTAHKGRLAYAAGFTGLGVGSTRFGAQVMLDLLDGRQTERTALEMVRKKPLPFPPEPLRSVGINLTRWSLDRADRNGGKRNLWLKSLDALGLGFDS